MYSANVEGGANGKEQKQTSSTDMGKFGCTWSSECVHVCENEQKMTWPK